MCEYCQNNSGLTDARGCCISCGAPMIKMVEPELDSDILIPVGHEGVNFNTGQYNVAIGYSCLAQRIGR